MSGVPVVGRYVSRSWSSGTTTPRDAHQPAPQRRARSHWRIPAFFKRKFEIAQRGGGRVGSTGPGVSEGGVAVTEEAFKDPVGAYKDPPGTYKDPQKDPLRESGSSDFGATASPYSEPERGGQPDLADSTHRRLLPSSPVRQVRDVGYREPRYLDLFDPGVSVVRDPKLDQPTPTRKDRAHTLFTRIMTALASTKVVIACSLILVVLVVVIVALASTSRGVLFGPDPRVKYPHVTTVTACGPAQGIIEDDAYVFRGLPYALPPVGKLRFRQSQLQTELKDCWTGTYIANVTRPCWSYDSQGAVVDGWEDCLLMDIFTPQLGYDSPLPVVVYIGGNSLGGDTQRPWLLSGASHVAKEHRVVLVAPQVRRGLLGFLPHPKLAASTYPHTAGNQGASDLLTALTWVSRNVEHFGGDPDRVTLLGHQAGAALAWPLLCSSQGHRLLHSAWVTGSAPLHPELSWRDADPDLTGSLNCSTLVCLESTPARTVMEAPPLEWRRPHGRSWLLADGIIVPFIPSMPQVPLMIGSTEQVAAEQLLSWRERLGTSHQQLVDSVVDGLKLDEVNYGQPVWAGSRTGSQSNWFGATARDPFTRPGSSADGYDRWPRPLGTSESRWPGQPRSDGDSRMTSVMSGSDEAEAALEWYSGMLEQPWLLLTTLVSDATVTCPALNTAAHLSRSLSHSHPTGDDQVPIYAYLSRHARVSRFGALADGLSDIESILGVFRPQTRSDARYARAVQDLFFLFVNNGSPEWHSSTPAHLGVYLIDEKISTERARLQCEHWTNATQFVKRF